MFLKSDDALYASNSKRNHWIYLISINCCLNNVILGIIHGQGAEKPVSMQCLYFNCVVKHSKVYHTGEVKNSFERPKYDAKAKTLETLR